MEDLFNWTVHLHYGEVLSNTEKNILPYLCLRVYHNKGLPEVNLVKLVTKGCTKRKALNRLLFLVFLSYWVDILTRQHEKKKKQSRCFPKRIKTLTYAGINFFQNACPSWRKNFELCPPTTLQKLAQSLCGRRHHHNGAYFEGLTKKTRGVSHCDLTITYIKGRRGPFSWSFPSIRPVIHPWMASYNNPLQCEGWKTPVVLQFAKS